MKTMDTINKGSNIKDGYNYLF
jgi:hypothetical protein